jgi:hypothetical protein
VVLLSCAAIDCNVDLADDDFGRDCAETPIPRETTNVAGPEHGEMRSTVPCYRDLLGKFVTHKDGLEIPGLTWDEEPVPVTIRETAVKELILLREAILALADHELFAHVCNMSVYHLP